MNTATKPLATLIAATAALLGAVVTHAGPRPNILFALADDMSHASAYGDAFLDTPHFDGVARRGVLFDRMHTPSSKCAPSRAVVLTGRNPWQLEGAANHKPVWPEKFTTVVEALTQHGYFTGFTGKGWNPGIHPRGRDLTGREYNAIKAESVPAKGINRFDYAANFAQFLGEKPEDQPFFFWYGSKEPHRGYEYKSGVRLGKSLESLAFMPGFWNDNEATRHDILDYAVEVEYFDDHLGRMLAQLEAAGELENTLIVVTSDNGMPFPRYKGHPHPFATRVPFAVCWAGNIARPGRRAEGFASLTDLAPTFLAAAGVAEDQSGMRPIQGAALTDFFADAPQNRDRLLTGRERNDMCRPHGWGYPVRGILEGDFAYLHNFEPDRWPSGDAASGYRDTDWGPTKSQIVERAPESAAFAWCFGKRPGEEFYDLAADPECLVNLAGQPRVAERQASMHAALFAELAAQGDPRAVGDGGVFDRYRPERIPEYDELVARRAPALERQRAKE